MDVVKIKDVNEKCQTDVFQPVSGSARSSVSHSDVSADAKDVLCVRDVLQSQDVCNSAVSDTGSSMFHATMRAVLAPVPLSKLLQVRGVYNVRVAPPAILQSMISQVHCRADSVQYTLHGRNSMQLRTQLRKQLARELANGTHSLAFADLCDVDARPRTDDIEGMIAAFPGKDRVNWSAEPVKSELDASLWRAWHARHCSLCTELCIHADCYFRLVHHFINTGFDPTERLGSDASAAKPSRRAYVDQWRKEETGCRAAFHKWATQANYLMSASTTVEPPVCYPLLPVVREKDRWLFINEKIMYKVRLCMDLKNGGLNDVYEDWIFRYLGIDNVASKVQQGDWLGVLDISHFYLRLPASKKLRSRLWFQDPDSYADCTKNNELKKRARYRQILAVAFGLKTAPAWASVVSAELARILESFGVSVAGVYIDDLLIRARSKQALQRMMHTCTSVCKALGLDLNDKTVGPCSPDEGIKYLGLIINTRYCSFTACPKQCAFAADKLSVFIDKGEMTLKQLESVAGTLTWISYAMISGRPRRNELYRAISRLRKSSQTSIVLRGDLKRQLCWWRHKLRASTELSSFFWNQQPDTPAIVSDASGEDGWGVCAQGYHIVGHWPAHWKQSSGERVPSMLYKELVGPTIAALLLAQHNKNKVLCGAFDNAGVAYVINSLTTGCLRSIRLLRPLADSLAANHVGFLAGHAYRVHNKHTDALSHSLNDDLWSQVFESARESRSGHDQLHFAILDIRRGECMLATMSFGQFTPRVANDLRVYVHADCAKVRGLVVSVAQRALQRGDQLRINGIPHGLKPKSLHSYKVEWERYLRFCHRRSIERVPGKDVPWDLALVSDYVELRAKTCKPTTVASIFSVLTHFGCLHGFLLPNSHNDDDSLSYRRIMKIKKQNAIEYAASSGDPDGPAKSVPCSKNDISLLLSAHGVNDFASFQSLPRRDRHHLFCCVASHAQGMRFGHYIYRNYKVEDFTTDIATGDFLLSTDWNRYSGRTRHCLRFRAFPVEEYLWYDLMQPDGTVIDSVSAATVMAWHFKILQAVHENEVFRPTIGVNTTREMRATWLRESLLAALPQNETAARRLVADVSPHSFRPGLAGDMRRAGKRLDAIAMECRWQGLRNARMYSARPPLSSARLRNDFNLIAHM